MSDQEFLSLVLSYLVGLAGAVAVASIMLVGYEASRRCQQILSLARRNRWRRPYHRQPHADGGWSLWGWDAAAGRWRLVAYSTAQQAAANVGLEVVLDEWIDRGDWGLPPDTIDGAGSEERVAENSGRRVAC